MEAEASATRKTAEGQTQSLAEAQAQALQFKKELVVSQKGIAIEKLADLSYSEVEKFAALLPDKAALPGKGFDLSPNEPPKLEELSARDKISYALNNSA